jgi:Icc-related predicted phosphoesterase
VRIWAFSDLHLDVNAAVPFTLPDPYPDHDVVVIAGDIRQGMAAGVRWIGEQRLDEKPVVYVGGNHEFYGHDRHVELAEARTEARSFDNIHVLDGDAITIDGVTFLGATLWTDYDAYGDAATSMHQAMRMLSDHTLITNGKYKWTPGDALAEHRARRAWLEQRLAAATPASTVVVTHHCPSPRCGSSRFRGHPLTACFVSDLTPLVVQAGLWIHGHSHTATDFVEGGCRVVNNPRGYVRREQTGFQADLVIEF